MAKRQSDSELVIRTRQGDQEAFGELVERYRRAVLGVAFHRLGDFESARDVAQDTFIKAYTNLAKLRKPESFASWLYHIADMTALEIARRPQREQSLSDEEMSISAGSETATSELAQQVREALATLDEPTRLAVVLHYIDGYSHAEVAQFLGTTPGAVRTRVSRAKTRLQEGMMSETERALKEAVARTMAAMAEYKCREVLEIVQQAGVDPVQHPDLARCAGVANARLALLRDFSLNQVKESARLLLSAWEKGQHDWETHSWLFDSLSTLGEYQHLLQILQTYLEQTTVPNEYVQTAVELATTLYRLGDTSAAVAMYRKSLSGLGEKADSETKLSYASWGAQALAEAGEGLAWVEQMLQLWRTAPKELHAPEREHARAIFIGINHIIKLAKDEQKARICELARQFGEEVLNDPQLTDSTQVREARAITGEINFNLFHVYALLGQNDLAQTAFARGQAALTTMLAEARNEQRDQDWWAFNVVMTIMVLLCAGTYCRQHTRKTAAMEFLKQALELAESMAYACGSTPLLLAALVLETSGNKQEALAYLRMVGEDKTNAYRGSFQKHFFEDEAFAPVRDDPEFLAVVKGWRELAAQG
jgi:RNA polymerase sigma-70 factor, ECF subfamily